MDVDAHAEILTAIQSEILMGGMILDAVLARFVEHSPITVMAQLGLERVLDPNWMDQLFEKHRGRQYQRDLLFSTTVDIMALVALGLRPSVHAAARSRKDLGVSLSARKSITRSRRWVELWSSRALNGSSLSSSTSRATNR